MATATFSQQNVHLHLVFLKHSVTDFSQHALLPHARLLIVSFLLYCFKAGEMELQREEVMEEEWERCPLDESARH